MSLQDDETLKPDKFSGCDAPESLVAPILHRNRSPYFSQPFSASGPRRDVRSAVSRLTTAWHSSKNINWMTATKSSVLKRQKMADVLSKSLSLL